jgi:NAD(P)-dependent dehydrogenase (short-subunit alcohol dehydrogenase family)
MMLDVSGRRVLVTGAASGIGRALAEALAARGATVVVADVDGEGAARVAATIGNGATAIATDLGAAGAAAALVAEAGRNGPLGLVCSNAGMGRNRRLLKETDEAAADRLFAVNFRAGLALARAYAASLAEGERGRILFTASENSLSVPAAVRGAGLGLYAATKHALLIAAEWLRDEATSLDVHVLLPGPVYTPLIAAAVPDPSKAPPGLHLISAERCAELALRGLELGLFYIPTHAHIAEDMEERRRGVAAAIEALGLGDGGKP